MLDFMDMLHYHAFLSWKPEFPVTVNQIIIIQMKSLSRIKVAEGDGEVEWTDKYLPHILNISGFIPIDYYKILLHFKNSDPQSLSLA